MATDLTTEQRHDRLENALVALAVAVQGAAGIEGWQGSREERVRRAGREVGEFADAIHRERHK